MAKGINRALLAIVLLPFSHESSTLAAERHQSSQLLGPEHLPDANYVRFTRVTLQVSHTTGHRRRLHGVPYESSDFLSTENSVMTVLVEEGVARACGRLLDERFERRKDCPLLPVPARAQREIADAEAADCESASGSTDARCSAATNDSSNGDLAASSGARACAALCVATLRCKSWSFRHPTVGLGTAGMPSQHDPRSGVSGEGRRALSTSRSLNRAPVRRSNSRSGSSSSRSRSSGGHRASNGRGYNASSPGKPGSAFTEAVAAQCQLFGFAMRGTAVAGASAAAALGLGQGARWSSGDIDRPAVVVSNATIYGGRVCDCGSRLQTRVFRGNADGSRENGAAAAAQQVESRRGSTDPRVLKRTIGRASQAAACLELFDECKAEREGRIPWPSEIGCGATPVSPLSASPSKLTQHPLASTDASLPSSSMSTAAATASAVQFIDGTVIALGQMWGDKVFHFMVEALARWASLPNELREHATEPKAASHHGRQGKRSRSSISSRIKVHLGPTFAAHDRTRGSTTSTTFTSSSANFKRQVELLALVGVPFGSIVRGVVRASKVIVPNSVTCGTPTHFQALSLRRLLLKAPPLLALLRAQAATTRSSEHTPPLDSSAASRRQLGLFDSLDVRKWLPARKPNQEHIVYSEPNTGAAILKHLPGVRVSAHGGLDSYSSTLKSDYGGSKSGHSGDFSSSAQSSSNTHSNVDDTDSSPETYRGRLHDDLFPGLPLDPTIKRLWSKPASIDVLVIERTHTRGLANHATLVDALQNWAPPEDARRSGEGRLHGQAAGTTTATSSSERVPLTVRVFSDRSSSAKRARAKGQSSSSSSGSDVSAWTQAEVLALFASAAVVVAPHGAGLANMLVMRPCATVIEARTASHPRCYEHLANRLGFFYHSACSSHGDESGHGLSVMTATCPLATHVNATADGEAHRPNTTHIPMQISAKPPRDQYAMVADVAHVVQVAADAAFAARNAAVTTKAPVDDFRGKTIEETRSLTRFMACQAAASVYVQSHAQAAEVRATWAENFA